MNRLIIEVVIIVVVVMAIGTLASPITNPLKSDQDLDRVIPDYFDSKKTKRYHAYSPNASITAQEVQFNLESGVAAEFSLRWSTTLGSPIYSPPVIFPSGSNGQKQIFVSTYYQYAELVDGDGYKSWGWPLSFEESSFQGSPMVYDVDGDGNIDMGLVDKSGNMFWVRIGESGQYLEDYHVQVPKLRVKKDWAVSLDPEFVDRYVKLSMFDRSQQQQQGGVDESGRGAILRTARLDDLQSLPPISQLVGTKDRRRRLSAEELGSGMGSEFVDENKDSLPDFGEAGTDDFMRLEMERYVMSMVLLYEVFSS